MEGLRQRVRGEGGTHRHKVGAIHAVSNVTFAINEGETFGLVGESGCGKTTIGRMVVGLEVTDRRSVLFDGKVVSSRSRSRRAPNDVNDR